MHQVSSRAPVDRNVEFNYAGPQANEPYLGSPVVLKVT